jgi:hypothetical protein
MSEEVVMSSSEGARAVLDALAGSTVIDGVRVTRAAVEERLDAAMWRWVMDWAGEPLDTPPHIRHLSDDLVAQYAAEVVADELLGESLRMYDGTPMYDPPAGTWTAYETTVDAAGEYVDVPVVVTVQHVRELRGRL